MERSGFQLSVALFLRLLIPLCLGVIWPVIRGVSNPIILLILFITIGIILVFFIKGNFYSQPYWGGIFFIALFLFGQERAKKSTNIFPELPSKQYFVVLDEYPEEKEKTFRMVGQLVNNGAKILIYLPKSLQVRNAKPGDVCSFDGTPELVVNDGNPFEFDYRRYLNSRGIGYRIFLKQHQFCFLPGESHLNSSRKALIFRSKLIDCLDRSGICSKNVHLIGSISFGAREEVDQETIQSFTNTGVIHVLAVSGMNVGLVYVILDFLFRFLKVFRAGRILHPLITLAGIWCYTLITGMSPSILRAAIMFSFVLLGTTLKRSSGIYNSLAVSAFLLIALDPAIVRDVGFQLSYAAVLSIVVIQPIIYRQFEFKKRLPDKIWLLISVTLAAQIGTLPLTLHYFHQFPVYFLLANIVVIPMVTLILYLSFVVIFLSLFSIFVASFVAKVLDWSVDMVIFTVNTVEALPHSVLRGLYPSYFQLLLAFLIGIGIFYFFKTKKVKLLQTVVGLAILLTLSIGIASYYRQSTAEIVFFNIPGTRTLALTTGSETTILYDRCINASEKLGYYMKPYLGERGISKVEMHVLSDSLRIRGKNFQVTGGFIYFRGIGLYFQPPDQKFKKTMVSISTTDLVWLSHLKFPRLEDEFKQKPKIILLDKRVNADSLRWRYPGQKIFAMNQSVRLTPDPSRYENADGIVCRYFSQAK